MTQEQNTNIFHSIFTKAYWREAAGQFKNTNVTLDKTTSQDHSLAELLKVRYQQTVVANEDGTYNVRFVIAIDDRSAYEQVIFTFTNEENQTSEVIVDKVCTSLYGAGIEYTPSGVTGTENAQYFCTFNLINIPVDTVLKVSAAVLTTEETPATWSGATQTISISAPNA